MALPRAPGNPYTAESFSFSFSEVCTVRKLTWWRFCSSFTTAPFHLAWSLQDKASTMYATTLRGIPYLFRAVSFY